METNYYSPFRSFLKFKDENVSYLINKKLILSAHDISEGGLLTALSEMSLSSNIGVKIEKPKKLTSLNQYFFGEDQGRFIIEVENKNFEQVEKILKNTNIYYENIEEKNENIGSYGTLNSNSV